MKGNVSLSLRQKFYVLQYLAKHSYLKEGDTAMWDTSK
jgi:hypothetical protein